MTTSVLRQRFPAERDLTVDELMAEMSAMPRGEALRVGDERMVDFLADVGVRLSRPDVAREHPELVPLGYFLRRANLARMLAAVREAAPDDPVIVPRGPVFHVPPANVSALLVYPWALSALAGNPNVVRLPTRGSGAHEVLLDRLRRAAARAAPVVVATQRVVTYGHDDDVTAALGAAARLRVLWGGDATVSRLRRVPVPPDTRDLAFPDRCSLAAISVPAWSAATEREQADLVERFHNDAYWYGQAACASPLTVCWVGEPAPARAAARRFVDLLETTVRRREPRPDPQMLIEQRVRTYGMAIEGVAVALRYPSAALATVGLAPGRLLDRWSGTGTFGMLDVPRLADLAPLLDRRHQTLGYFGFGRDELTTFVRLLGHDGVDRVVPIGEALAFEPIWDGHDLLREFVRPVVVR